MAMGRGLVGAPGYQTLVEEYFLLSLKIPDHAFSWHSPVIPPAVAAVIPLRIDFMAKHHNHHLDLDPPFPSALGSHRPRYGFHVTRHDKFCFHNFYATYAARYFLLLMIGDEPINWHSPQKLSTSSTTIRSEGLTDLEDVLEYQPTPQELSWEPTDPQRSIWRAFLGEPYIPQEATTPTPASTSRTSRTVKGLTSLQDLCERLGIDPSRARRTLRAKATKPAHGWAWAEDEIPAIEKILRST